MLLKVENIKKSYFYRSGFFKKKKQEVLKGVSFELKQGESLAIVGESGSGKSTLGRLILGLEKADSGKISFEGKEDISSFRKHLSVVFQDYVSSVNPQFKVEQIIKEPLLKTSLTKLEKKQKVLELLKKVGLSEDFMTRYPHELSGGQLQRVCIARAIANKAKFILLDEAVNSLDVTVQVQILDLLKELKKSENLSFLFISHDLLTVTYFCDKVIFFKDGQIVEKVEDIKSLKDVKEEYSKALLGVYH